MGIFQFLGTLDPNVISLAVTGLGALGGWLWHKARGDHQDTLASTASGFARQAVHDLLLDPAAGPGNVAYVRAKIETVVDAGLAKLGTFGALMRPLVRDQVEHAIADALDQLRTRDVNTAMEAAKAAAVAQLGQRWEDLMTQAANTPAIMKAAAAEGLARGQANSLMGDDASPASPPPPATPAPLPAPGS